MPEPNFNPTIDLSDITNEFYLVSKDNVESEFPEDLGVFDSGTYSLDLDSEDVSYIGLR